MARKKYYTVKWKRGKVSLIDQRYLPSKEIYRNYSDHREVVKAIRDMEVRGAPAIGVATALGIALGVSKLSNTGNLKRNFDRIVGQFKRARPTAVNLFWAAERMVRVFNEVRNKPLKSIKDRLIKEAKLIYNEDIAANMSLALKGHKLIKNGWGVLTHCNAGPLATAGWGTALGVIIMAAKKNKRIKVFADETRPRLQGARLTAWELMKHGLDATLISDNMAAHCMKLGLIDIIITGADRIAANGDTANKIGTYNLAVLAKHHGIPFYIAAPLSTIDPECKSGKSIPIEERSGTEITNIGRERIAPMKIKTFNPAFDITPASLIRGIITEKGIIKFPYKSAIRKLFRHTLR